MSFITIHFGGKQLEFGFELASLGLSSCIKFEQDYKYGFGFAVLPL